jgi:hypothetical protein
MRERVWDVEASLKVPETRHDAEREDESCMSAKQIEVTCPCCTAKLTVDVLTARVMRTEQSETKTGGDKWDSARDKVSGRTQSGAEKLENALNEERGKKARLDDLFKQAQDKLKKDDG